MIWIWNQNIDISTIVVTRIIQSLYYAPAGRYINAWMHSLKKSFKLEIVNRYDLWVLQHKIGNRNYSAILAILQITSYALGE